MKYIYIIVSLIVVSCIGNNKNIPDQLGGNDLKNDSLWITKNVDSLLEKNTCSATNGLNLPYRFYSPNIAGSSKSPLVIFLHGRGERGSENGSRIYENAGIIMNENSLLTPQSQEKYPCYVLVPQCSDKTENEEWAKWIGNTPDTPFKGLGKDGSYHMNPKPSESGEAALELIQKIINENHIDIDRVYLVGLSMGGFGTWEFTAREPDLFAAAIPMAGYSDPHQIENIKHIPYWIFHGDIDKFNPVEGSRNMYQLLSEAGSDVSYTEYENVDHGNTFKKAFNEPELIPWLFSKRKLKASLAYQIEASLGEGAIWNHKTQKLLWIDIEGRKLHEYDPKTHSNNTILMPSRPGTVVPERKNDVLVALEDGVHIINTKSGKDEVFTNMSSDLEGSRLNDGKCDPSGRLWVGSMHLKQLPNKASLFMINNSGNYESKIDSVTISNGIVWTSDGKTMYYIDTPTSHIKAYDFDNSSGRISNERIAVEVPENLGFPDGMTIDEENMLWVAMWNGNAVIRFNPITGKVIRRVDVPAHNVTSCAFGGKMLETLYITTARVDMTDEELVKYPLAGSVFKVDSGVKGVKSTFFIKH